MRALLLTIPVALLLACSHDFGFLDNPSTADASSTDDASTDDASGDDGAVSSDGSTGDAGGGVEAGAEGGVDAGSKDAAPDVAPRDAGPDAGAKDGGPYTVCGNKTVKGCNPITNDGCGASSHCVWQSAGTFECVADNGNKTWPSVCNDLSQCAAGYDCFPTSGSISQCVKYCCVDQDCPGTAPTCGAFDQVGTCQ